MTCCAYRIFSFSIACFLNMHVLISAFNMINVSNYILNVRKLPPPLQNGRDKTREMVILHESATASMTNISEQLAKALDLVPLIESVARYTGTKRGHDAILSLLDDNCYTQEKRQTIKSRNVSKRKRITSFTNSVDQRSSSSSIITTRNNHGVIATSRDYSNIVKMSHSTAECKNEWRLIDEAMLILSQNNNGKIDIPPIYPGDSSPFDTSYTVDTDDDEWLIDIITKGWNGDLELENILQADQIVNRILKLDEWCSDISVQNNAPSIACLCGDIEINKLQELHNEIKESVIIEKGKQSYEDPSGTKSYSFELDKSKFPALSLLGEKEKKLSIKIDSIVNELMSKRKYMTIVKGGPYALYGRVVFAVNSKENAFGIGTIRGNVNSAQVTYVEPREIMKLGDELVSIRDEINIVTSQISNNLSKIISGAARAINTGLDIVSLMDTIFARAAFGSAMGGIIPYVGESGQVKVENFVHPVLTMNKRSTIPIDLLISNDTDQRSLIISGPNAGGKTLAMKSFGTVAIMNRLGIPIPTENNKRSSEARIDFFHNVLVEMGDNQNVMNGESTYIAQLNSLSKIISKVYPSNEQCCESSNYHLILLDEVGDGTDPDAGSCIAQAILEKILESSYTRTICTTHSSRLKALSITDNRFKSASVLLQSGNHDAKNRLPTYKLSYDTIGQSNALSAVMRTNPKLPEDLIKRASNLISSSNDERGEEIRTIMEALEREKELAHYATEAANAHQSEMKRCRDALVLVAKAYDQQLSRVEDRLDSNFALLKTDDSKDSYDLVGDSITTLRLVRKKIKTLEDTLKEKGMRMVMDRDQFKGGESVTIIQEGDYVGENAIVHYNQEESHRDEVIVEIEKSFDWIGTDQKILDTNIDYRKLKFKRHELAVWDYPDYSEDGWEGQNYDQVKSIPDSRSRLIETLNSFKGSLPEKKVSSSKENDGKQFTSSRQRKAASKSTKKQKKKKK